MPVGEDPIIVAPSPTPFHHNDRVNYEAIERNVRRWLETPLSGFVLNSENGEEAFLSEQEQWEIVHVVRRASEGRKLIIGGIDSPGVTETLRKAEAIVAAGAELVRIRIPRLTANVRGYFEQVVPRVAAPVVIIHQPAPGTFLNAPAAIAAPAELIGEIVAMDNVFGYIASADLRFEARVRTFVPADKRYWTGNGSQLLAGFVQGATGACMMLGNVAPRACREILRLAAAGRLPEAQQLQTRLLEADWQILTRGAAGLKAALELLGFEGGPPRAPMPLIGAADRKQIRTALWRAGLIAAEE